MADIQKPLSIPDLPTKATKKSEVTKVWGGLTVLMMASTAANPGFRNSTETLDKHGFRYRVVGLNEPWGGWPHRMRRYMEAAAEIAETDPEGVVVCMDAYDGLSVRSTDGLLELFRSFNKPLVLSLESVCMGNCVSIRDWWRTHGQEYLRPLNGVLPKDRYVNGGLLMGYAWAIRDLYAWMLEKEQTDDQMGLARYVLSHRESWAPDVGGRIFKNKVFGAQLTDADLNKQGTYFAHFPGLLHWSAKGYDRNVKTVLKRPSGIVSKEMGSPAQLSLKITTIVLSIILVVFALLLAAWTLAPQHYKTAIVSYPQKAWNTLRNAI